MTDSHRAETSPSPEVDASSPAPEDTSSDLPPNPLEGSPFTPPPPGSLVAPFLADNFTHAWQSRHDGWTPERKRLFLDELSQWGVVARAVRATGMSAQSAYDLRNRDPLFAAGWQAAIHLVRHRVADEALTRSLEGVVEPVYHKGEVVGERRRYDNRLTLGLLHRLDRIAERDEDRRAGHPRAAARWGEYLEAMGEGRDDDVRALLDPEAAAAAEAAKHASEHQDHQVSLRAETQEEDDPMAIDQHAGVWPDQTDLDRMWTDYPPPQGFRGEEVRTYGKSGYKRRLSDDEEAEYRLCLDEMHAENLASGEAQRLDYFFGEQIEEDEEVEERPEAGAD